MSYVKERSYAWRFKHREVFLKFKIHSYGWGFGAWGFKGGFEVIFYKAYAYFHTRRIHEANQ